MPYLSNYPAGAMNDPRAPFNQPDASGRCNYEHADEDECQWAAEFECECGTECCCEAIVTKRLESKWGSFESQLCPDCAERYMLHNPERLLRHAKDHLCAMGLTLEAYQDALGIFNFCLGSLAAETQQQRYGTGAIVYRSVA